MWQDQPNANDANPLNRLTYSQQAENLSVGKTKSYWTNNTDGLPAFLAHCGVPHEVIHEALTRLPQRKTLLLCKPSEDEAWEIRVDG